MVTYSVIYKDLLLIQRSQEGFLDLRHQILSTPCFNLSEMRRSEGYMSLSGNTGDLSPEQATANPRLTLAEKVMRSTMGHTRASLENE